VFDHHQKTIANLKEHFEQDRNVLAFILNGSVARGDARKDSDVDFFLVVSDAVFDEMSARNSTGIEANEFCVEPCTEADGDDLTLPDGHSQRIGAGHCASSHHQDVILAKGQFPAEFRPLAHPAFEHGAIHSIDDKLEAVYGG
jgi:hypothetical protein